MPRVALVAYHDFTDIDLFLAWDLFCRMPTIEIRIVAPTATIRSSTGLRIDAHGGLAEAGEADGVYLTSGRGSRAFIADPALLGALALDPARQIIAAVDSGAAILAALGHLRGKRATTYPSADLHEILAAHQVTRVDAALVVEGTIATAAQCLAGVALVEWLAIRLGADPREAIASVQPLPLSAPRSSAAPA
jgi:putative intracellular protease/amidase